MLTLDYCLLCRRAAIEDTRLNLYGADFYALRPSFLPGHLPDITVAIVLMGQSEEANAPIPINFMVVDEQNRPLERVFAIRMPSQPEQDAMATALEGNDVPVLILHVLKRVYITTAGVYRVIVQITGLPQIERTFVILAPPSQPAEGHSDGD